MMRSKHLALMALTVPFASEAQHTIKHYNILWAAYHNTIHLDSKWSIVSDAQVRTIDWADQWLLYAARTGLSYSGKNNFSYTAGFALFRNSQYYGKKLFFKNEWRPWEEVANTLKAGKRFVLLQRLRLEERFLQQVQNNVPVNIYQFICRFRYKFEWQYRLDKTITFSASNEIFVNPGYLNSTNFFDQNRTFAGFNIALNSHSTLQNQYIKIFQWHNKTQVLDDQNIIRITLYSAVQ